MPLEFNFIESFVSLLCWISCFLYLISFYFLTCLSEDILLLISQQIYKRDNSFENLGIYKMFILLLFLNYGLDKVGSIFVWIWWDCFNSLNSITIPEHSQTIWFLIMYNLPASSQCCEIPQWYTFKRIFFIPSSKYFVKHHSRNLCLSFSIFFSNYFVNGFYTSIFPLSLCLSSFSASIIQVLTCLVL